MSIATSPHLDFVDIDTYLPTRCGTKFPVFTRKTQECKLSHIATGGDLLRWSSIKGQQGKGFQHNDFRSNIHGPPYKLKEGWMCVGAKFWAWALEAKVQRRLVVYRF